MLEKVSSLLVSCGITEGSATSLSKRSRIDPSAAIQWPL